VLINDNQQVNPTHFTARVEDSQENRKAREKEGKLSKTGREAVATKPW